MNNSSIALESQPDPKGTQQEKTLREMEIKTVKIVEALEDVQISKSWSSLKELVFDNLVSDIEKSIQNEAKKGAPDPLKLNRLTGKLSWAEKYADLRKLADEYRLELTRIRKMLYGKENES